MLLKRVPAGEIGVGMPGALRPAVQAAFASIVMHYQGRRRDSLMPQVQTRLEEAVSAALHNGSRVDGDAVIRCTRGAGRGFGVRASDTALDVVQVSPETGRTFTVINP